MEDRFKRESSSYSFDTSRTEDPFKGRKGENLDMYMGPVLAPPVIEELKVWADILSAIKDGLPKPYDNTIIIKKIIRLEKETGEDLSELKNCCPPMAEIREAKEIKPLMFGIMDRIIDISGIKNYVERYER